MSGSKCYKCFKVKLGYCPFDYVCEYEVWENFRKPQKHVEISKSLLANERLAESFPLSSNYGVSVREVKKQ